MTKLSSAFGGLFLLSSLAPAAIKTEVISYKQGGTALEGYLAYDDAKPGKKPGVVVVHDWMGMGPYVKMRTEQLAGLGYIAFAADIYGKNVRPKDAKQASEQVGKFKGDRPLLRARAQAALDVLKKDPRVDPTKLAAMGYCFGGTTSLELARSGADVKGVVSFHGSLATPTPDDAKQIKGRVLVLHGADDPHVPLAEVNAFEDEMRKAGVDWVLVKYSGAVHAFTEPAAGNDNAKGVAYNEKADKRSFEEMRRFFSEIF